MSERITEAQLRSLEQHYGNVGLHTKTQGAATARWLMAEVRRLRGLIVGGADDAEKDENWRTGGLDALFVEARAIRDEQ